MSKPVIDLVFRKPEPYFNSIENVFNALVPHLEKEFNMNRIELPHNTSGVKAMLKNRRHVRKSAKGALMHVTGHEHYLIGVARRKTVLTLHDIGSAFTGKGWRDRFINHFWFIRPMRMADYVTVISQFSVKELHDRYRVDPAKVQVVSNPLDDRIVYNRKFFNYDQPLILQVGTKGNKNLERVAEALKDIKKCRLLILGKLSKKQKALIEKHGIDYENRYHVPYEQVFEVYKMADILLFPSLYEGFGMPILEAQATGRPVITSSEAAMPETAGDGALIVDPYDVNAIRTAVQKVIKDEAYRDELIRKGLKNAKKYSAEMIAGEYAEIYRKLLPSTKNA